MRGADLSPLLFFLFSFLFYNIPEIGLESYFLKWLFVLARSIAKSFRILNKVHLRVLKNLTMETRE